VLWATKEGGFDQVGCVYTAQGFEYDWSGVIIGPDLTAHDGRTFTVRGANKDPAFKRRSIPDEQYDQHIRNIYKVLLTRGMIGTVIYAVDPRTQELLAELIEAAKAVTPSRLAALHVLGGERVKPLIRLISQPGTRTSAATIAARSAHSDSNGRSSCSPSSHGNGANHRGSRSQIALLIRCR
jgi:hypothetical protein